MSTDSFPLLLFQKALSMAIKTQGPNQPDRNRLECWFALGTSLKHNPQQPVQRSQGLGRFPAHLVSFLRFCGQLKAHWQATLLCSPGNNSNHLFTIWNQRENILPAPSLYKAHSRLAWAVPKIKQEVSLNTWLWGEMKIAWPWTKSSISSY